MTGLAWRSLRARRTAFTATAVSVLCGSAVLTGFLSLLETGLADDVGAADGETLVTVALVVGGWAAVIVLFSVASLLALTVRRRAEELNLLRTVGTTRGQLRRLVVGEALLVALLAAAVGLLPGGLLGRLVLDLLQEAGLVDGAVAHRLGWLSLTSALGSVLPASALAGLLAARAATRGSAQQGLTAGRTRAAHLSWWRIAGGIALLAMGATYTALTLTVTADSTDRFAAMATAGPASVFWSLGLAVFAPVLLTAVTAVAGPLVRRAVGGVPGHLAVAHSRRRAHQLSGILVPALVFVGIATGTLYLMQIHNAAVLDDTADGQTVVLVNYLVVGMIALFAAIMLANGILATVADRRREFTQQRLAGVTRAELVTTVAAEGLLIAATAVLFGGLASLGTVIPFALAKTDGWLPDGPGILLGVAAVAVLVTAGTAAMATRRATAGPVLRPQMG